MLIQNLSPKVIAPLGGWWHPIKGHRHLPRLQVRAADWLWMAMRSCLAAWVSDPTRLHRWEEMTSVSRIHYVVPWLFEDSGETCSPWWTRGDLSDSMNYIYIYTNLYIDICSYILYTFEEIDIIPHLQIESPIVEGEKSFCKAPFLSPAVSFPPESLPSFVGWNLSSKKNSWSSIPVAFLRSTKVLAFGTRMSTLGSSGSWKS